jgi:hypothetical protein
MTGSEIDYVRAVIDNEGFDYAFRNYTDFVDKVKDEKFHVLRLAYVKAAAELAKYVGDWD